MRPATSRFRLLPPAEVVYRSTVVVDNTVGGRVANAAGVHYHGTVLLRFQKNTVGVPEKYGVGTVFGSREAERRYIALSVTMHGKNRSSAHAEKQRFGVMRKNIIVPFYRIKRYFRKFAHDTFDIADTIAEKDYILR